MKHLHIIKLKHLQILIKFPGVFSLRDIWSLYIYEAFNHMITQFCSASLHIWNKWHLGIYSVIYLILVNISVSIGDITNLFVTKNNKS